MFRYLDVGIPAIREELLLPESGSPVGPVQFMFTVILVSTSGGSSVIQVRVRLVPAEIILLLWSIVTVTLRGGTTYRNRVRPQSLLHKNDSTLLLSTVMITAAVLLTTPKVAWQLYCPPWDVRIGW